MRCTLIKYRAPVIVCVCVFKKTYLSRSDWTKSNIWWFYYEKKNIATWLHIWQISSNWRYNVSSGTKSWTSCCSAANRWWSIDGSRVQVVCRLLVGLGAPESWSSKPYMSWLGTSQTHNPILQTCHKSRALDRSVTRARRLPVCQVLYCYSGSRLIILKKNTAIVPILL